MSSRPVLATAPVRLVVFDLDGTLVDSVPDLAAAINATLVDLGLEPRGEAQVRHWVGNGAERLVHRALSNDMHADAEPELFARAMPRFLEHYAEQATQRTRLYPGVQSGLEALREMDLHLACVTNKPQRFTTPLLAALGLDTFFPLQVCGDTLAVKKPDPGPLLYAADFFKVPPEHALMVGDSINDIQAARAAGFRVICVPYGYNHGEDIEDGRPDAVIQGIDRVPALLH